MRKSLFIKSNINRYPNLIFPISIYFVKNLNINRSKISPLHFSIPIKRQPNPPPTLCFLFLKKWHVQTKSRAPSNFYLESYSKLCPFSLPPHNFNRIVMLFTIIIRIYTVFVRSGSKWIESTLLIFFHQNGQLCLICPIMRDRTIFFD